ncbi:unnamed protein product [Strongylus vulgaris]|uniref:Uncharacterized protein n=1 Tax=Strongylus vulgaris TaxID=40348 RepID=A0A3P7KF55_STRVU|nr:unnamed protein product [Strongylus vulgaris]
MIRPRHAVVSPDVCRRYDQHQRLIARSRRSTSCSSSEASDDEEGKRLSLLGSKYCGRKPDNDNDPDDGAGGQGGVSGAGSGGVNEAGGSGMTYCKPNSHSGGDSAHERRSGGATDAPTSQQHLFPIPEMTHLDNDNGDRLRAKLLHRSHTAERIARNWATVFAHSYVREISCFGTPPRDMDLFPTDTKRNGVSGWIHSLKRTRSDDRIPQTECVDAESLGDSVFDAPMDSADSSRGAEIDRESDSGCSSERAAKNAAKEDTLKAA